MTDQQGDPSFEERLRIAREKRGMDNPPHGSKGSASNAPPPGTAALGVGMRVGVELLSALVVAVAIGWALDRWLHTAPFLLALFVLLGGGAGVANVWRLVGPKRRTPGAS